LLPGFAVKVIAVSKLVRRIDLNVGTDEARVVVSSIERRTKTTGLFSVTVR